MLTVDQRTFLGLRRVAHLATADAQGVPHIVPVCFALGGESAYIVIDAKPKRTAPARIKRMRNIAENPRVRLVADHYEEEWDRGGWVALHGHAEVLSHGAEHAGALRLLRERYPQYTAMALDDAPVIAVRVKRVSSWGRLDVAM